MNKNVLTFIGCDMEYAIADTVLLGVPFDGTASFRPGSRFAPNAIRQDSYGLETYSPYADRDLADCSICDIGDLELPFGNADKVLEMTEETVAEILSAGKRPLMLGGEHLVTLGAIRAMQKRYPDLHVVHLDAHTDLRDEFMGEPMSHATVIRRVWNLLGDGRIHQFGIRSGEKDEFTFADAHTDMHRFSLSGFAETLSALKGKPVYFTLDLDILDPAWFPGTGTPEPGGVSFTDLLSAVLKLHKVELVGCDVVELAPHYDPSGASTAVACKLVREILLQMKGA
ncbi:MAG TPA: agmatinase [Candidatus Limiplasma sp.]|nr:agmatinase [Candidatus Limiplasma sp.]HRX07975.1 agmatinase [Candidatus Limiplasma sp.]